MHGHRHAVSAFGVFLRSLSSGIHKFSVDAQAFYRFCLNLARRYYRITRRRGAPTLSGYINTPPTLGR
jgi:hypothetical protein